MPISMRDLGIDCLSAAERFALAQEIWASLADEPLPALSDAQRQELDRRIAAHRTNPQAAIPWEQVKRETLERLQG